MANSANLHERLARNIDGAAGTTPAAVAGMQAGATQRQAAHLVGLVRVKGAFAIPLDRIEADPDQPRTEFDVAAIERLAESLRTRGQLQPIRVRWHEPTGLFRVMVGERRWRAARHAGLPSLNAIIHDGPLDADELLSIQLVENVLREDLKPVEQARGYRRLMEHRSWSANQLARELAISHTTVTRALSLLDLPAEAQEAVDSGRLPARAGHEIARLDRAEDRAAVAAEAVAAGLTGDQVAEVVKARRVGRVTTVAAATRSQARRELRPDGEHKVIVSGPAVAAGPAAVVEVLRRALRLAQAEAKAAAKSADADPSPAGPVVHDEGQGGQAEAA